MLESGAAGRPHAAHRHPGASTRPEIGTRMMPAVLFDRSMYACTVIERNESVQPPVGP